MSYSIVLGDLKPMPGTLTANGAAFPLELTDVLTLSYETPSGTVMSKVLTITSAAAGEWVAEWIAGDLPEAGSYIGQITVARAGDSTYPRSFPDDGSMVIWWVYRKID